MNIVLTGFMASGKTAISKAISHNSEFQRIDTDDMIVDMTGKSINDIFAEFGEDEFRRIEHKAVCKVSALDGYVIATGGGVVLDKDNIKELRKNGVIVNLAPDFEVIVSRLANARRTRPLLKNSDIEDVKKRFLARLPYYEDRDIEIRIVKDRSPQEYAEEILTKCRDLARMREKNE